MDNPIRVLGIAPYEGMKTLMSNLAAEYPQMDLTPFVGDRELGLEIARANFHGNYDVVISRGDTASILRQNLSLPVVEIEVSMYDILYALKLANGLEGRTAIVAAVSVVENVRALCGLMDYRIEMFSYDTEDDIEPILRRLRRDRCQTVLCDTVANATAKRLDMDSFLITSSGESIRQAFDQAILLSWSQQRLRDENLFFRELIHGQIGQTVVFDESGTLYFSTLDNLTTELLELLRRELPESWKVPERRVARTLGGMLYSIRSRQIRSGSLSCVAFFVAARRTTLSPNQVGVRFSSRQESESSFYGSIFSLFQTIDDLQEQIERINQSRAPVLVSGEDGTGKESIVQALYLRSSLQNHPLISINCSLLNDKSWAFLLEHHNSPLTDKENTLYFASIDVLSEERMRQLLAALMEMDVCRQNRVLFSCVCQPDEYISAAGSLFLDKLRCLTLYLPPLRAAPQRIPALVNLSIAHFSANVPLQILGAEPEAVDLLQRFPWPHNYTQFQRVMKMLAVTASGQTITAAAVSEVLKTERHMGTFSLRAENAAAPLDLSRTLSEIDQDVVQRVVEETGGNQTAAAKRLGISRTTLWRLLQKG